MTLTHPFRAWLALPLAAAALLTFSPAGPVRAAPPPVGAASDLDLTASQKARMEAGRARFQKDVYALQTNPKLSEAQKRAKAITLTQAADKDTLAILTPAQRSLVLKQRGIEDQFRRDVQALRTDTKMPEKQKQARFEGLMTERQAAMLATLPPAQRARAERAHQAQVARVAEANKIGAQLQKSLSKQTQGQIEQITQAARSKMQAVSADAALSQPAKAAKIQALGHEAEAQINTLLTPAQRVQFARYHQIVSAAGPQ